MDDKRNRIKRKMRPDDNCWDCSVCTFRNPKEAFKCEVCDTRKGTSTRKPRINTQVVELQEQIQKAILKDKGEEGQKKKKEGSLKRENSLEERSSRKNNRPPKLQNVDRSKPRNFEVTSNGVTVTITEFRPRHRASLPATASSHGMSSVTSPISPGPSSSCSSSLHGGHTSTPGLGESLGLMRTASPPAGVLPAGPAQHPGPASSSAPGSGSLGGQTSQEGDEEMDSVDKSGDTTSTLPMSDNGASQTTEGVD